LSLEEIGDYAGNTQFDGDGTADHPPLYNRDVLAFLPFQVSSNRFVIPIYVMTTNVAKTYPGHASTDPTRYDMPPETYRLTIGNIRGTGADVSAFDPLTGADVSVTVVSRASERIVVELPVTDSPRLLTLEEALPATATTQAATSVTRTGATLNATVNPNQSTTSYHFEYGTTKAYGGVPVPPGDALAGSDASDHAVSQQISGLEPATTYHYRVVVSNEAGTSYGEDRIFTTLNTAPAVMGPLSPPLSAPADLEPPGVRLGGKLTQRTGKAISVIVRATSEDLRASASGTVAIGGSTKTYSPKGVKNRFIARGQKATLKLKLSKKAQNAINHALRRHRRVRAKLTVAGRDAAGNLVVKSRTIKLKR
ncbi:MAG TPA: hypothetical protein VK307_08340, partial [Thermoleophilaceae bacterium]|nr:hypothetical protein [Thermoleophilaceae bacterium]